METVVWTVVYGTLGFLMWRALTAVRVYVQMWRALMKLPQTKSHWLYGHMKQVRNNTIMVIGSFALKMIVQI